jgi:hypothetical protein
MAIPLRSGRSAPLGRSKPHRPAAGRVLRAAVQCAKRFQYLVDAHGRLQSVGSPETEMSIAQIAPLMESALDV